MKFSDIPGNEDVKRALISMADTTRVAHAMLFFENDGCGALALALAYVQYLNCPHRSDGDSCGECPSCRKVSKMIHSDLHFVFPTNAGSKCNMAAKDITSEVYLKDWISLAGENPYFLESELIAQLGLESKSWDINVLQSKKIIERLSFASVENGYKTVLCYLPEKMNAEAANKLLKLVEEPPEKTLFLFITHNPDKVLQTISSRCQSFRLMPLEKGVLSETLVEKYGVDSMTAEEQASICSGSLGQALHNIRGSEEHNLYLDIFSDLVNACFRGDLLAAQNVGEQMAELGSREKQKALCTFFSDCLRKIFILQKGMDAISFIPSVEEEFFRKAALGCGPSFCERMLAVLDRLSYMIERNVNQKILFCDFVNRVFVNIKK